MCFWSLANVTAPAFLSLSLTPVSLVALSGSLALPLTREMDTERAVKPRVRGERERGVVDCVILLPPRLRWTSAYYRTGENERSGEEEGRTRATSVEQKKMENAGPRQSVRPDVTQCRASNKVT